jgi:3-hydroxyisobutyrate dehydrogenase-like beta-hydroxyacid dehydrogenase
MPSGSAFQFTAGGSFMPHSPTSAVTFIGLGAMGRPMAARLHALGRTDLTVYDISAEAMRRARGIGRPAASIRQAIEAADVIMTMLPADAHVREVVAQVREHGRDGQVFVDFSTVHPETISLAARQLGPGVTTVSASCMKSVAAAVSGDLTLYLGGERDVLDRLDPLLAAMASTRIDVGAIQNTKALKLINNMMVASTNLAIAEMAVIGARHGVSYPTMVSAFDEAGCGGWALRNQVMKHTLTGDLGPGLFSVRYMAKDVTLAAQLADDSHWPRFLCGPVLCSFRGAIAQGHGDDYHPVTIRWLESIGSVSPPDFDTATGATLTRVVDGLSGGMAVMDQLIAWHGLGLAATTGIAPGLAAASLNQASAASWAVAAAMACPSFPDPDGRERLRAGLEAASVLAVEADMPAIAVECAHDYLAQQAGDTA